MKKYIRSRKVSLFMHMLLYSSALQKCADNSIPLKYFSWARELFNRCKFKKLIVGTGRSFYPFNYYTPVKGYVGYEIDLCEAMEKYFEIEIEYRGYSGVSAMFNALQENEVDLLVSSLGINSERRQIVNFSPPYFENFLGIMVSNKYKDTKNIAALDIPSINIAVSKNSTADAISQKMFKKALIKKLPGAGALGQAILQGEADVVIGDTAWIKFFQEQNQSKSNILIERINGTSEFAGIALAKNRAALLEAISIFILQYTRSDLQKKHYQRWF